MKPLIKLSQCLMEVYYNTTKIDRHYSNAIKFKQIKKSKPEQSIDNYIK
mgnify:CR=1 FL=1